jgi:HAD superfamily hydrolase (TIGR01509 family)
MRFEAILFDCDGVLVDSESITNGVLRDMLEERGWTLTREACMRIFIGKLVQDEAHTIEKNTGQPVTAEWLEAFRARRNAALHDQLVAIDGIHEALHRITSVYGTRIACASGADRQKVELQLTKVGLMKHFQDRIFSGHEMKRSKPAPDVYLAAAAALGVDPQRCAVVEDTPTGATAGIAAGCTVFGYVPPAGLCVIAEGGASAMQTKLARVGVQRTFAHMDQLADLLV